MKKTVLTFGLISGLMISVLMGGSLLIANRIGSGHSMVLGYTMMVASFLLIYFGIRSYRDNELAGQISFGRAFSCGILIALITTVCYVVMWEIVYFNFMPHFMDTYFAAQIHKVQSSGLDPATTATQIAAIQRSQQSYQNLLINMAYTFIEPLPVGLLITLISAAILRRKSPARRAGNVALTDKTQSFHQKTCLSPCQSFVLRTPRCVVTQNALFMTYRCNGERMTTKAQPDANASAKIAERIASLVGWRGETLAHIRKLILAADPGVQEEWKWETPTSGGVPVWSHDGIICTGESYKEVVKLTFARGAAIPDPQMLFNSSLEGNVRRAIDIREGEKLNETAFKQLILAAVAANSTALAERAAKKKKQ